MNEYKKIKDILDNFFLPHEFEVYAFGSRVKGTNRPDSDLDLLIMDDKIIEPSLVSKLEEAFEESNIPYKVDLVVRSRIDESFYNKIKNDLVLL
jgi:predicted nucleotidyltransferase